MWSRVNEDKDFLAINPQQKQKLIQFPRNFVSTRAAHKTATGAPKTFHAPKGIQVIVDKTVLTSSASHKSQRYITW
jgi:hypothetical protein